MAIKVNGTEIISNARVFDNFTKWTSSSYKDFYTDIVSISTAIDFDNALMIKVMTANTTFTESNKATGRCSFLYLDTSDNAYTPTFSANIEWPNDTEPTWSNNRYWHIGLVCWDGTTVRGVASGYGGTGVGVVETVTLSGTTSSYNLATSVTPNLSDAVAGWKFKSDGTLFKTNVSGTYNTQFNPGTEWCNTSPGSTYYIRATITSGSLGNGSDSDNVWLALTIDRTFQCVDTTAGGAPAIFSAKIDIATDSGGSNIIATGYYSGQAVQEPQ